ncbi:ketopantoate reductase family protein [Paenibacillus qinlingensis]|uniref:ketopantoate reductase family protein n=1 Tax=Paenibacillus qinlingensis TaxID=1837343 RepID=UPI0015643B2E|nr:2-dehydropantoate 2-reductase [Paenibacillus qinlingensis]NQX57671.1 2-dehydropantoate 2-reductase [Paenibacillus qinlingensis]
MHIMIIGAGSLGLLFAAKLAPICSHLTVVTRSEDQAIKLAETGIQIIGMEPLEAKAERPIVFHSYSEETGEASVPLAQQVDYIFLMVKQTAISSELINYIQSQMTRHTYLICFQNGMGHEVKLGQAIGWNKLLFAVTTEGAKRTSPTSVNHTGHGITYLGALEPNNLPAPDNQHIFIVQMLELAGFRAELSKNMGVRIWSKLVVNVVINPLTAILRVQNGELLRSTWTLSLMQDLYQEALHVAAAKGVELPVELWDTIMAVCESTKTNHSSMLQDIEASRHTEVDYLNGSLVKMGNEMGIELPANSMVYRMIKAIEN